MPADVPEKKILQQAIHLRVAFTDLHKENAELQAVLGARLALPDPGAVYTAQITEKQGQVTQMQEALTSAARDAYDLLKGLQECSTSLTVKTQPISAQLQQLSKEIQDATDPSQLDQLYAQAYALEVQIQ